MRDLTIRRLNNYPFNFFDDMDSDFKRLFKTFDTDLKVNRNYSPDFEVIERDEATFISADLPGIKKEDIKIEYKDGHLLLSGERKSTLKERDYTEKKYGVFKRSFKIPKNLDASQIQANFEDGVLTLALPKKEEEKAKEIEIKLGEKTDVFNLLNSDTQVND
tara:strand:+ start:39459 stop:39944 length:486 start_codon:yes stop_codon:yes gene_type:complete